MIKFLGWFFLGYYLILNSEVQASCKNIIALLWDGQNPARVLAQKLEPTFRHVRINKSRVQEIVQTLANAKQKLEIPAWNYPPYLQTEDPVQLANFLLILNSNNFSFFDPESGLPYQSGKDLGSSLATKRLVEAWPEISDPHFLRNVSPEYVREKLFKADIPVSMVDARTRVLREVGDFIFCQGARGALNWIESLQTKEAGAIAVAIPVFLPSWRDPFFKRSQLFLGMLYGRFQRRTDNPIDSHSLEQLTVFADYRLPQTLRAMGILDLSEEANLKIESGRVIAPGSELETELRAASILAADLLLEAMNNLGVWGKITVLEIDFLLWSVGRSLTKGVDMPGVIIRKATEHHTVTTDY